MGLFVHQPAAERCAVVSVGSTQQEMRQRSEPCSATAGRVTTSQLPMTCDGGNVDGAISLPACNLAVVQRSAAISLRTCNVNQYYPVRKIVVDSRSDDSARDHYHPGDMD